MDKILEGVLNAGIALYRTGEDSVSNAVKEVQRNYNELKEKGSSDSSEAAQKLRLILEDINVRASGLTNKAGDAYKDGLKQLEQQYAKAIEQIKNIVPTDRINEVKEKADELTKAIRERIGK